MKKELKIDSLKDVLIISDNYQTVMDAIHMGGILFNDSFSLHAKYAAVDSFITKVKTFGNIPEVNLLERELKGIATEELLEYE